ncbi:MAG: guanylate kinase [Candidatus Marinimicrobia bacterium]|nr:guanylate kinase [Candidatus Neomarinimicrobiota bacterium]
MLLSMTGFGKAEGTVGNTEISVELRSVNSRYLEIYVAAPKYLNFLEDTCRKSIRERISRGNIHCLVNLGNGSNTLAGYTVNLPLLNNFVEIMHKIADETGVKPRLSMQDLLSQPELLSLEESSIDPEVLSDRVREILERAAGALLEMEKIEGKYIRKLFTERLRSMEDRLNRVVTVQRANVSAHIAQMKERVRSLLEDEPGELSFRQEVVQLADKLDAQRRSGPFPVSHYPVPLLSRPSGIRGKTPELSPAGDESRSDHHGQQGLQFGNLTARCGDKERDRDRQGTGAEHTMKQGLLLIFVSFSGGGKSTIVRILRERHPGWRFSVSCTTRKKRPYEAEGVHYYFISRDMFEAMVRKNAFIEYERVHGELYGTPREPLEAALRNKETFLLDIDVKGALRIMKEYPEQCVSFFIDVPDMEALEERLRKRGTEAEAVIQKRLSRIPEERKEKEKFDHVIINDKLDLAVETIEKIIIKKSRGTLMKKDFRFKGKRPDDIFEAITAMANYARQINQKRNEEYPIQNMVDAESDEDIFADVDFNSFEKPATIAMSEYEKGNIEYEYEEEEDIIDEPETGM